MKSVRDAGSSQDYRVALALRHIPGLGPRTWKRLLERYQTLPAVWENRRHWQAEGLVKKWQIQKLDDHQWRQDAERELHQAVSLDCQVVLYTDPVYPECLRQIPDPPVLLYVLGNTSFMDGPCLAVVGSRRCTEYGLQACRLFSKTLSEAGLTIVSGFAAGIDSAAHESALFGPGSTIAVLGTGLDIIYPALNRNLWERMVQQGLIITEFAPGMRPEARNFPHRNRIISGLCLGVLVVEGAQKSGSLITAKIGLDQNREVFALPGPITSHEHEGCHHLIKQGATLVQHPEDILTELAPLLGQGWIFPRSEDRKLVNNNDLNPVFSGSSDPKTLKDQLDDDQWTVVNLFRESPRMHIDQLSQKSGLSVSQVSQILVCLEVEGLVHSLPGMMYELRTA